MFRIYLPIVVSILAGLFLPRFDLSPVPVVRTQSEISTLLSPAVAPSLQEVIDASQQPEMSSIVESFEQPPAVKQPPSPEFAKPQVVLASTEGTDVETILAGPQNFDTLHAAVSANAKTLKALEQGLADLREQMSLKATDTATVSESGSITVEKQATEEPVVTTTITNIPYQGVSNGGSSGGNSAYASNVNYQLAQMAAACNCEPMSMASSNTYFASPYSGGSNGTQTTFASLNSMASDYPMASQYQNNGTVNNYQRAGLFSRIANARTQRVMARRAPSVAVATPMSKSAYAFAGENCRYVVGADGNSYKVCE